MADTYATRTFGTPTSPYKFTISFWVKRSKLSVSHIAPITAGTYTSTNMGQFLFSGDDTLLCQTYNAGGSATMARDTNMKFRDTNGWYNIVLGVDGTLASAGDRQKLYVNGELITSFAASTDASQDTDLAWNQNGIVCMLGNRATTSYYFDGYLSHVHFIDGTQYQASDFGSTDATTGQWKINTAPSVTYGNNGFFVLKNGNSLTDQSTNSNDFTLGGGAIVDMKDCPSDVYATMNNLDNYEQGSTFTVCNTKLEWNTNNKTNYSTFAMNKGKFYWEMKYANITGGADAMIGMSLADTRQPDDYPGHDSTAWSYYASNGSKYNSGGSSYGDSWTTNDIIGVAFDADTRTLWFSKNGTWQNSATISEIAAGTTTNAAWTGMGDAGDWFIPCMSGYDGNKAEFNFGNGYFSTTPISDEGTNASGVGKFEYDVPNNFTALSTKGLNI